MKRLPEIMAAFAAMDSFGRDVIASMAIDYAKRFPAKKTTSHLALVPPPLLLLNSGSELLDESVDKRPTLFVGSTVGD